MTRLSRLLPAKRTARKAAVSIFFRGDGFFKIKTVFWSIPIFGEEFLGIYDGYFGDMRVTIVSLFGDIEGMVCLADISLYIPS